MNLNQLDSNSVVNDNLQANLIGSQKHVLIMSQLESGTTNNILCTAAVIECSVTDHCTTAVWMCHVGQSADRANFTVKVTNPVRSINYQQLNSMLDAVDWSNVFAQTDAFLAFDLFYEKISNLILSCKTSSIKKKKK